jgi:hypothetical protein
MNLYRFDCTVFVRGNTPEEAAEHLAGEVQYHFSLDNDLVSLIASEPELAEDETDL